MTSGRAVVHLVFPELISKEFALSCLTAEEKSRANQFRFTEDAIHWVACRANLRKILGQAIHQQPHEVPIVLSEYGKPELAPPYNSLHFNLSHCANLALVVLCTDGPVGVDLEPLVRAEELLECKTTFCHPGEINILPLERTARAFQLLSIWTAKEAVLKALGTGLSHSPESIRISFREPNGIAISDQPLAGIEDQRLHGLDHLALVRHRAVVSVPQTVNVIEII